MTYNLRTIDEIKAAIDATLLALHKLGASPEYAAGYTAGLLILATGLRIQTELKSPVTLEVITKDNGGQIYHIIDDHTFDFAR
jgi:hypothetical protein